MRGNWHAGLSRVLPGLPAALLIAACAMALYLLTRALVLCPPEEAHRAVLRLRGTLAVVTFAWYGRCILLPTTRWRIFWWLLIPGIIALVPGLWPFSLAKALFLLREAIILGVFLGYLELLAAVLRRAGEGEIGGIPEREATLHAVRRAATRISFLTGLMTGGGLYLIAVDYVFNYFLYSAFGAVLVMAVYLCPQAILAKRMEAAAQPVLSILARREQETMVSAAEGTETPAFSYLNLARYCLTRSTKVGINFWDLLCPVGVSALLLLAAVLFQW